MTLEEAVECAIQKCIENEVLAEFFTQQRQEFAMASVMEYNFEKTIVATARENYEDGHAEGHAEGLIEGKERKVLQLVQLHLDNNRTIEEIALFLGEEVETIQLLVEKVKENVY